MLSRLSTKLFLVVGSVLLASGLGIAQLNEPSADGLDLRGTTTMLISEQQVFGYRMAVVGIVLVVGVAAFLWGRAGRPATAPKPRRTPTAKKPVARKSVASKPVARKAPAKKAPARGPSRR